jgi:hypothetical protein
MAEVLTRFEANPDLPYEVISQALPEARMLAELYWCVQEGKLAPVIDLARPETDYYLERINELAVAMNQVVCGAYDDEIPAEIDYEPDYDPKTVDWANKSEWYDPRKLTLTNTYFQMTTGSLFGIHRSLDGIEQAVAFEPQNINDRTGSRPHKIVEQLYVPSEEALTAIYEEERRQFLEKLHVSTAAERARRQGLHIVK